MNATVSRSSSSSSSSVLSCTYSEVLHLPWQVKSISTPAASSTSLTIWTPLTPPKMWISTQHNCLAASDHHAVVKSDDSLVQQGWPFHKGGDMWGRSPWLNGTPLSDCQSSGCHRVASLSSCSKYYARTPGWINLPLLVCCVAWTASRFVKKKSSFKCMNFEG